MPPPVRPQPPASPRPAGAGQPTAALTNPAVAARLRQLAAQAEHRRAFRRIPRPPRRRPAGRINALLLEAIAALATLLGAPGPSGNHQP